MPPACSGLDGLLFLIFSVSISQALESAGAIDRSIDACFATDDVLAADPRELRHFWIHAVPLTPFQKRRSASAPLFCRAVPPLSCAVRQRGRRMPTSAPCSGCVTCYDAGDACPRAGPIPAHSRRNRCGAEAAAGRRFRLRRRSSTSSGARRRRSTGRK